jgi:hypothetical protein
VKRHVAENLRTHAIAQTYIFKPDQADVTFKEPPANHRQFWRKFNDFRLPAVKQLEKAAVMAQARREPRFSEIEVLPPVQAGRMAHGALEANDVSDADFETLPAQTPDRLLRKPLQNAQPGASLPDLGLLKQNAGAQAASRAEKAGITPGFAAVTVLSAIAVFWLCGGHALLY